MLIWCWTIPVLPPSSSRTAEVPKLLKERTELVVLLRAGTRRNSGGKGGESVEVAASSWSHHYQEPLKGLVLAGVQVGKGRSVGMASVATPALCWCSALWLRPLQEPLPGLALIESWGRNGRPDAMAVATVLAFRQCFTSRRCHFQEPLKRLALPKEPVKTVAPGFVVAMAKSSGGPALAVTFPLAKSRFPLAC